MGTVEEKKVVERAYNWRETEKKMIAARGVERKTAADALHLAKNLLREAIDLALRKAGEP